MTPAPKIAGVNLTSNPPHNTRIEVNIGVLSILFSYGSPIAYDYHDGVKILDGLNRHQQRHANQWRRFDKQKKLTFLELAHGFLTALTQESEALATAVITNTLPEEAPMPDSNEPIILADDLDNEVDDLDNEEDDDEEFDDADEEDEYDEEEDEDEEDFDDDDYDTEDEPQTPPPLKENEY